LTGQGKTCPVFFALSRKLQQNGCTPLSVIRVESCPFPHHWLVGSLNGRFFGPGTRGFRDTGVAAMLLGVTLGTPGICRHFALGLGAKAERASKLSEIPTHSTARNIPSSCLLAIVFSGAQRVSRNTLRFVLINGAQFIESFVSINICLVGTYAIIKKLFF
jgi:hypothetical protein